jgi:hypothetical protein
MFIKDLFFHHEQAYVHLIHDLTHQFSDQSVSLQEENQPLAVMCHSFSVHGTSAGIIHDHPPFVEMAIQSLQHHDGTGPARRDSMGSGDVLRSKSPRNRATGCSFPLAGAGRRRPVAHAPNGNYVRAGDSSIGENPEEACCCPGTRILSLYLRMAGCNQRHSAHLLDGAIWVWVERDWSVPPPCH